MSKESVEYKVLDKDGFVVYNGSLLEDSIKYLLEDPQLQQDFTVYKLIDNIGTEPVYELFNTTTTN